MAKRDKRIEAIKRNPRNVRFATVKLVLEDNGFVARRPSGGSSHWSFSHPQLPDIVTVVERHPFVARSTSTWYSRRSASWTRNRKEREKMAAVPEADALRTVDDYMCLPYRMEIYWDGDYWAAEIPTLPGFAAAGETWDELNAMIDDAKRAWFQTAIERGTLIPEPQQEETQFSGKLQLRLPKSLHRRVAIAADRDGVSLNTYIVSAVSAATAKSW